MAARKIRLVDDDLALRVPRAAAPGFPRAARRAGTVGRGDATGLISRGGGALRLAGRRTPGAQAP